MNFIVIDKSRYKILVDSQNKIIGRTLTPSYLKIRSSDNHLYFGTPENDLKCENLIKEITGFDIDLNNRIIRSMFFNGDEYTITISVSNTNSHIQFHVKGKQDSSHHISYMVKKYIEMHNLKKFEDYAIFLNFKNNEIFFSKYKINKDNIILLNDELDDLKNKAKTVLDDVIEKSKKYKDVNKRNAYIDTMMSIRSPSFQKIYRNALLNEFDCKCALCGINVPKLLIASHIVAYCDCNNNEERIDPNNGLLLCSMHDDLFDKGYISFDSNGKIVLPKIENIPLELYNLLNINENIKIDDKFLNVDRISYLKRHIKKF